MLRMGGDVALWRPLYQRVGSREKVKARSRAGDVQMQASAAGVPSPPANSVQLPQDARVRASKGRHHPLIPNQ